MRVELERVERREPCQNGVTHTRTHAHPDDVWWRSKGSCDGREGEQTAHVGICTPRAEVRSAVKRFCWFGSTRLWRFYPTIRNNEIVRLREWSEFSSYILSQLLNSMFIWNYKHIIGKIIFLNDFFGVCRPKTPIMQAIFVWKNLIRYIGLYRVRQRSWFKNDNYLIWWILTSTVFLKLELMYAI